MYVENKDSFSFDLLSIAETYKKYYLSLVEYLVSKIAKTSKKILHSIS